MHWQKSKGLKTPSHRKRRLNLGVSRKEQSEKRTGEGTDENEIIDTCYGHVVKEIDERSDDVVEEEKVKDDDDDEVLETHEKKLEKVQTW